MSSRNSHITEAIPGNYKQTRASNNSQIPSEQAQTGVFVYRESLIPAEENNVQQGAAITIARKSSYP